MKRRRKNQGIITVFVILIMVPTVVITGTLVDAARFKLCSSQAAMAADAYGEVVLSEYDNLLKELYGLFSVTQSEDGKKAIEELAQYMNYSFSTNGDQTEFENTFLPYKSVKADISYEAVEGATLSNPNVLMTQISDFMKYRIIEEVLEESGILEVLEGFEAVSADMEAVETRDDITTDSAEILAKIQDYYNILKKINEYPSYIKEREDAFKLYSAALTEVLESEEYEAYVYYLENKEQIDAAKAKVEGYKEPEETEENGETQENALTEEEKELAEKYVDTEAYKKTLEQDFTGWPDLASVSEKSIAFGDVKDLVNELNTIAAKVEKTLRDLTTKVENLREKLPECSEDVKQGIEEDIRDLEQITALTGMFSYTANLLKTTHDVSQQDNENKEHWSTELNKLKGVQQKLLSGKQTEKNWANTIQFDWYSFRQDSSASSLFEALQALCENETEDVQGDKNKGKQEIEKANAKQEEAEASITQDETTEARSIGELASQLETTADNGSVPGIKECLSGGLSLAGLGTAVMDKFLIVSYDFGMFSSRVSGVDPDKDTQDTENTEDYTDKSLTKVEMSRDINYLYGAEIEYLLAGHNDSAKNLNHTRNIICGVRFALNYASTYSIDEINKSIKTIANAAAQAVAASLVGVPAAPLVKVAVSGALRSAFAMMESASDWKLLKQREEVCFYKKDLEDLSLPINDIKGLLGGELAESSGGSSNDEKKKIKLSYEDYTYALLIFFTGSDDILARTSNLITLNVNQSKQKADTLTTLNFKMSDTVTAVKSTCKIKFDFAIVPDNFLQLFSTASTNSTMEKVEEGTYGYSVIRGY